MHTLQHLGVDAAAGFFFSVASANTEPHASNNECLAIWWPQRSPTVECVSSTFVFLLMCVTPTADINIFSLIRTLGDGKCRVGSNWFIVVSCAPCCNCTLHCDLDLFKSNCPFFCLARNQALPTVAVDGLVAGFFFSHLHASHFFSLVVDLKDHDRRVDFAARG